MGSRGRALVGAKPHKLNCNINFFVAENLITDILFVTMHLNNLLLYATVCCNTASHIDTRRIRHCSLSPLYPPRLRLSNSSHLLTFIRISIVVRLGGGQLPQVARLC